MDAVALGELLIDFSCVSKDEEGYPTMAAHPGGAPANFLAAMAKLGAKTALLGKVGRDSFGKLLTDSLERAGVDTDGLVSAEDVFTTLAFVTLDKKGEREFSFARKPGADSSLHCEELKLELIDSSKLFHFGTLSLTDEPSRSATYRAVDHARSRGKLISFDPNLRRPLWKSLDQAAEQMLWGLSQADIVKISDEEVNFLWGLEPEKGAEYIIESFGVKLVFVTCGAGGCYYRNGLCGGHVPALGGIEAIDTTGAGDIFGGTAAWMLLKNGKAPEELCFEELENIAKFATAAAGISVTRPGGISSVPSLEEIEAVLNK